MIVRSRKLFVSLTTKTKTHEVSIRKYVQRLEPREIKTYFFFFSTIVSVFNTCVRWIFQTRNISYFGTLVFSTSCNYISKKRKTKKTQICTQGEVGVEKVVSFFLWPYRLLIKQLLAMTNMVKSPTTFSMVNR